LKSKLGKWRLLSLLLLVGLLTLGKGYWNATRDPIVRTATLSVDTWPQGQAPLRLLLLSDVHVAGPDMPPERVRRLVAQLNALRPDLVLIAGDLVSEKQVATQLYSASEIAAPLAGFKAALGTIVTLGNHDHWFDPAALHQQLEARGVIVLSNEAVARGPLIVGGVGDDFTRNDDLPATYAAMKRLGNGPRIILTHSPDIVPALPEPVDLVLAGHTHCGQISLPLIGAVASVSRWGDRFACGLIDDKGQKVIVTAGLGTSILPLRYGAPPDVWLVTMGLRGPR
jgi:uncharacterized protein